MGRPKVANSDCFLIAAEVQVGRPVSNGSVFLLREVAEPPVLRESQGYVDEGRWFCWDGHLGMEWF